MKQYLLKCSMALGCFLACTQLVTAQTDADAIMIPKNYLCPAAMFSNNSWNNYWEGTFKRNNLNIGTLTTNTYTAALVYGLTSNINLLAAGNYVTTHASAGTLEGLKGLQDFTFTVKWRALRLNVGGGKLSLFAIASGSIPLSNYQADFEPVAIGLHSKTASFRAMADYYDNHFFATLSGQYIRRSDLTIDRTAYYTTQLYYTNQVYLPDASNFQFRTGYRSGHLIAEAILTDNITNGGFDIRKNDMPFPGNRMNSSLAGANFKYSVSSRGGLEISAGADRVLDGRNVGQSTVLHAGLDYLIPLSRKQQATNQN
jgi:hypothetical protein